jgi:hypothetical protein
MIIAVMDDPVQHIENLRKNLKVIISRSDNDYDSLQEIIDSLKDFLCKEFPEIKVMKSFYLIETGIHNQLKSAEDYLEKYKYGDSITSWRLCHAYLERAITSVILALKRGDSLL